MQDKTATGRTRSSPNLQDIPVKSELGQKIRSAFVKQKVYRVYCDHNGREFGTDYTKEQAKQIIEYYSSIWPNHRYYMSLHYAR